MNVRERILMSDHEKSKAQLIEELETLRARLAESGPSEIGSTAGEEALPDCGERFNALYDRSLFCIFVYDLEGRFMDANMATLSMLGYSREEFLSKTVLSIVGEAQAAKAMKAMEEIKRNGFLRKPNEYRLKRKDGRAIWIEVESCMLYREGKPRAIQGVAREITERKCAEDALRNGEEKYRALFEESQDAIFITTPEGKLADINPAGLGLFGFSSKEEILKIDVARDLYFNPRDREKYQRAMAEQGHVKEYEIDLKKKDGQKVIVEVTAVTVCDGGGNITAYRGIMRDVTTQKQLEQQVIQSQKMEGIGRLAAGIAHDFNNLLTSIIGYAGMMQMKLDPGDPHLTYVNQIVKVADRCTTLVKQILAFSRKSMIQPKILDLNDVIENFETMFKRVLGEDMAVECKTEEGLGNVKADPGQIEQIIMNLAVNSRDAMPKGGKLLIETGNVEIDEEYIKRYPYARQGRYVLLSVSDTGCGMDEETLSHIFEPFFTTKEKGVGTGLGLSTVYGIVKQSEGHITVASEVGKGTTVQVYLPRIDESVEGADSLPPASRLHRGKETVLVVEDDESVRELAVEILSECGHTALEAKSGEDALSLLEEEGVEIDLLLTDVVMYDTSGRELAEKLSASRPGLKVLYMSGYSEEVISHHGVLDKDIHFIQKPFTPVELTKKIREILDT